MGLYSLKSLEQEFPSTHFMRIHKSYIVALDKISEVEGNQVMIGKWSIPVSKAVKTELLKKISGEK